MDDLKRTVEAILFAAGRKLELEEISKLCKRSPDEVRAVLVEMKAQLDAESSSTMLVEDGTGWKLTVREKYVSVIKQVVSRTELPKGHLETLAVVAYKAPVLQSKVIRVRTNKAYDHLSQLEESGYITREKSGRTKLIKLTPKFFEYFDIDPSKLKNKFGNAVELEKAIEVKEQEIESAESAQLKQAKENLEAPHIVIDGQRLETVPMVEPFNESLPSGVEIVKEQVGGLDVVDIPLESIPLDERPKHKKKHKHKHEIKVDESVEVKSELTENKVEEKIEASEVEQIEKIEEKVVEKKKKHEKKVVEEVIEKVVEEKPVEEIKEGPVLSTDEKISKEVVEKSKRLKSRDFEEGKGLFPKGVPPEMEAKIDEKIRILLGEKSDEKKDSEEK